MKLAFVFFAVLGLTYALPAPSYSLRDDVDDFLALIPKEELVALYRKYQNDDDVKRIVAYLKSGDFAKVVHIIAGVDEIQRLVNYLESKNINVIDLLNRIADRLGLPHWPGYATGRIISTRSWRDLLEEAKQIVPLDKIKALAIDKLANSEDFGELFEKIAAVDGQRLHDQALSHPEIKDAVDRLTKLGLDVKKVWDTIKGIFGWGYSTYTTRSLRDDVDDFLALIPKEELVALYHKYQNDEDVKRIVAYLKSGDFAKVVHIIAGVDEIQRLVNYLESKNINVIDLLNRIADRLGLPHWPGYAAGPIVSTRSWRDLLEEAKQILPLDKIKALAIDKLANSEDFGELFEKIAAVDGQRLHDQALSHPEIRDAVDRLTKLGLDVKKVWDTIKGIFGWGYSTFTTRSLRDDVDDFLALIPKEELVALYRKYQNDEDVKRIVAYLKSGDFAKVVHIIAGVDEIQRLVNYLESKNINVIDLLNRIADRLGLPHWPGYAASPIVSTRSWRDLLEEAKQIVPLDKIKALAIDKLANSEDFGELFEKIAAVDGQRLHDQALSHPEIRDAVERLTELGFDVKKVWETVRGIFGW